MAAGAAASRTPVAPPGAAPAADFQGFLRHQQAENLALREQCQAMRLLLEAKEDRAREANTALQLHVMEGEQIWQHLSLLQAELDRCNFVYAPALFAAPEPAAASDSLL